MSKLKIMISQPMRGKTNEQIIQERKQIVKNLEKKGYKVIDSVLTEEPGKSYQNNGLYYLAKSIDLLAKCDAIYMMNGWEKARGCIIEYQCAKEYDMLMLGGEI